MTPDSTLRATSLLWEGLYRANVEMVMRALDQGADVNAPFSASGLKNSQFGAEDTPLHGALNSSSKSNGARVAKTSKANVSGVGQSL